MQNQEIIKKIENLKGRRAYEEKKALKDHKKELEEIKTEDKSKNKVKKSCSCC